MPDYHAYIVGDDRHFQASRVIQAPAAAAVKAAKKFVDGHNIDVWHLDRKIAVLSGNDQTGAH